MRRILYLGYYFKQMNWQQLNHFTRYVSERTGITQFILLLKSISNSLKYNTSILEYFQFRFFELSPSQKVDWAGTGFMYEYQLKMNPPSKRGILDDKRLFFRNYSNFMIHLVADEKLLAEDGTIAERLLANPSGKIVFKGATGKCGAQVQVRNAEDFNTGNLLPYLRESPYDLVEEFVIQHHALNELSPSAVNTVRIFTQLNDRDEVEILGCRLRISVNSSVDNLAAGNLAAPIDSKTGVVIGPGVYSDISKPDQSLHPITGKAIIGFKVPFWPEILKIVAEAALAHPENRSIGWDIVVTERGPGLIEGNHDWCKLLWQLPVKQGLKPLLLKYQIHR